MYKVVILPLNNSDRCAHSTVRHSQRLLEPALQHTAEQYGTNATSRPCGAAPAPCKRNQNHEGTLCCMHMLWHPAMGERMYQPASERHAAAKRCLLLFWFLFTHQNTSTFMLLHTNLGYKSSLVQLRGAAQWAGRYCVSTYADNTCNSTEAAHSTRAVSKQPLSGVRSSFTQIQVT
jgi:hypothetical protein